MPIVMGAGSFFGSFCWKTPTPKNSRFRGGFGFFLWKAGGSSNFIFMGVGIFPTIFITFRRSFQGQHDYGQHDPQL